MRLIWMTPDEPKARAFGDLLSQHAIDNLVEKKPQTKWDLENYGSLLYQVWVQEEDQVEEGKKLLERFIESPETIRSPELTDVQINTDFIPAPHLIRSPVELFLAAKLKANIRPLEVPTPQKARVTSFFTFICCLLFITTVWNTSQERSSALFFDYPKKQELIDTLVYQYGEKALVAPNTLPPQAQTLLKAAENTPTWIGIYEIAALKIENKPIPPQGQLFEKISQGEFWRIVTPIFLHADFLHLFFNMIWLILLAPQIEIRVGMGRFLLLTLCLAAFSNTVQYLSSGPAFIGFSGVICGYAAFIWTRMRNRPWEGYVIQPGTFAFLLFFVSLLASLSVVSFFLEIWFKTTLPIGIANSAHISGGLLGIVLGGLDYFRSRKEDSIHKQK